MISNTARRPPSFGARLFSLISLTSLGLSVAGVAAGCSFSPPATSEEATPPVYGRYEADPGGPIVEISFYDATHYVLWTRDCPEGKTRACREEGTFVLDMARGTLTLTDRATGTKRALPVSGIQGDGLLSRSLRPLDRDLTGGGTTLIVGEGIRLLRTLIIDGQEVSRAIPNEYAPVSLLLHAIGELHANIDVSDVGKELGVGDDRVPYPDTYWPFTNGGTDSAWNGEEQTPIEKLMAITAPESTALAKTWEKKNHGPDRPGVANWWGHCPGWTAASMATRPILHAVDARKAVGGGVESCPPGTPGCTHFEIGDINALEAEVYLDGRQPFAGARCDLVAADIQRDTNGRIMNKGCRGLNPGAIVVLLGNRMKRDHLPIAIDAQNEQNTNEIWNQPAYRYKVYNYEPLTLEEAANLVAHASKSGDMTSYPWNEMARGFVKVEIGIKWVVETAQPNKVHVSGLDSTRETRFSAVLELDAPESHARALIIGGEFLDDSASGANRLTVPPFMWTASEPGPESLDLNVGVKSHNPWVHPSDVAKLVAMGSR